MPKTVFAQDEINNYFKDLKDARHHYYGPCVEKALSMAVHADGVYPESLIDERRPNEPEEVKAYRKKIWKPKTKPTVNKVLSELQKIRRSSDWSIKYQLERFTKIAEEDNLEAYCEQDYPDFGSLTTWAFSLLLRKAMIDPNALLFVLPETFDVAENEYLSPVAQIYDSVDVIDFVPEDYAVLNDPTGSEYYNRAKKENGKAIYVITTIQILRYEQVNSKGDFKLIMELDHGLPILPVRCLKGVIVDQKGKNYLYESRIAGMIPELDEAVREYSDLQASKVLHIYAERWEYTQNECVTCKGTGKRQNPSWCEGCDNSIPAYITCDSPSCNHGYVVAGPYSKLMVRPLTSLENTGGANQIPMPPAGYIEKDVEIVKIQGEGVRQHIYDAMSAINFEFLADVPLSQSGEAKKVDMDALNNTVHSIAEDIVSILDDVYKYIAYYRYKDLYSFDDIDEMLPKIPVPEKFDILTSSRTMEELTSSKNNKANPVIISALEIDYASKRFNNDPEVRDAVQLILKLDPLPNITEDDKMSRLSNKGITLETYVISSNIQPFIQKAINEEPKFVTMKLEEQKKKLAEYAKEVIELNSPATEIIDGASASGLNENQPING